MYDVTFDEVEQHISYETYFTAAQGALEADGDPGDEALENLTICALVLNDGFVVTGEFFPTTPETNKPDIRQTSARLCAIQKIKNLIRDGHFDKEQKAEELNHG